MVDKKNKTILDHLANVLAVVAAIVILISFIEGTWSYKFYVYRRSIVFIASVYIASLAYINKKEWYLWPFLAIAVLFNPFVSINLDQEVWRIVDLLAALVFIFLR
ncbi:DUF6804 family protein [Candidatus Margulisiibacteriota bacterium]